MVDFTQTDDLKETVVFHSKNEVLFCCQFIIQDSKKQSTPMESAE